MGDFKARIVKPDEGDPIQVTVYDVEGEPIGLPVARSLEFPEEEPLDEAELHANNGEYYGELQDADDLASLVQVKVRFPGEPKTKDYPKDTWEYQNDTPNQYEPERRQ